jgi:hypothetical protein
MKDKLKIEVISFIDTIQPSFIHTIYEKELKQLRAKYIYKDISKNEVIKDVNYLKCLKNIKR